MPREREVFDAVASGKLNKQIAVLRAGDAAVEEHFTAYFGELIYLKLRGRLRSHQLIEDIRQETLLRVLRIVQEGGLEHPERLGAFVNAVSNNVMLELLRQENRLEQMQPAASTSPVVGPWKYPWSTASMTLRPSSGRMMRERRFSRPHDMAHDLL